MVGLTLILSARERWPEAPLWLVRLFGPGSVAGEPAHSVRQHLEGRGLISPTDRCHAMARDGVPQPFLDAGSERPGLPCVSPPVVRIDAWIQSDGLAHPFLVATDRNSSITARFPTVWARLLIVG